MSDRKFLPEWAPQSGVMLTWPHPNSDWQPWLSQVEPVFTEISYHVAQREGLLISCFDQDHLNHVRTTLEQRGVNLANTQLYVVPSNDTWARDHGPLTILENDEPKLLDFTFNGWGGKYESKLDNAITGQLAKQNAFAPSQMETIDLVLEGGSVETDGLGTLLTTSACLLTPTRNPHLSQKKVENRLSNSLGLNHFLWLNHGYLAGDDTDSHIDTLARFCDPKTICYVVSDEPEDEHYAELKAMEKELQHFQTPTGEPYRLVPLPMTEAKYNDEGDRLPATYANFLIINGAVLVPTYEDKSDNIALERLSQCFPDREIIAINCLPLVMQYGSLHCVTMQLPQGVLGT